MVVMYCDPVIVVRRSQLVRIASPTMERVRSRRRSAVECDYSSPMLKLLRLEMRHSRMAGWMVLERLKSSERKIGIL
jgi:hypothetical protein